MTAPRGDRRVLRGFVPSLLVAALLILPACRGGDGDAAATAPDGQEPAADAADPEAAAESDESAESAEGDDGDDPSRVAEADKADVGDTSVPPLPRHSVEIYFPSSLKNGLVGEFREIFATSTPGDRAKQIIADLISGPSSPEALRALPADVRLRQAYVLDNGVAYLDFNAALTESVGGGSMEELLVVYSIVDSVVLNVPEIKRVGILVDGRPLETLNGHVDLRHPLRADRDLILGSIVVRLRGPSLASA